MELILMLVCAVLAIAWDHVMVIPKLRNEIAELRMERDSAVADVADWSRRCSQLEDDYLSISQELGRLKDPEYYAALDAGDGQALWELDKRRGDI